MEQLQQQPTHLQHIVLFTHNEQSHITPMFALARLLVKRGLTVTCALPATSYASYCRNNNSSTSISDSTQGQHREAFRVEPVAESPKHPSDDLKLLHRKLEKGLIQLMRRLQPPPSFLIADYMYFSWSQEVANCLSVKLFLFSPFCATSLLVACHLQELVRKGLLPFQPDKKDEVIDFIPGLMKGFRIGDAPMEYLGRTSVELEAFNYLELFKAFAGVVFANTSQAFHVEAEAMDALVALGIRNYPMAPMLHMDWCQKSSILYREDDRCMTWLDRQPRGSVVYVAFGSIIPLTKEEIHELALGLEASGQPFLWVIRRIADGCDVMSALPPGFLERINDNGCIVSWAPQMAVLSHASVGCFLCHCGTASVVEAMWTGVPMIAGFYKISEQNTVFRVITDYWRIALPIVQEGSDSHSPLRRRIEAAIKELLHGDGGAAIRERITKLRAVMQEAVGPNGISRNYFEEFVSLLLSSNS